MKKYLLFILTVFIINFVVAQTHNVPSSGNNTWTTCSGHLYDCGGANSNYVNSCNGYTVIYPATTGALIRVQGTYSTESNWDYIYIYDGEGTTGTLLATLSGTGITEILTSTTGPITVRFYSDGSSCSYSGFDLTVSCYIPTVVELPSTGNNSVTTCEGFLYDDGGEDNNYSNDCDGYTTLYPGIAGNNVSLSGTYSVENNNDFIYIYDGEDTNAPLIATLTGTGTLTQTTATNGAITVQLVSNATNSNFGINFNITCIDPNVHNVPSTGNDTWTTCGGHLYDAGGPTGNYGNYWDGYTVIYPSTAGAYVRISGTLYAESSNDYISFYDGVGTTATLIQTIYGSGTSTLVNINTITSTSGPLTVKFHSDSSIVGAGFDLTVTCYIPTIIELPNTGNNTGTTCEGILTDNGGLDGNYSNNCNGYTTIYPGIAGNNVSLSGTYSLENNNDFIYIYDGVGTNGTLIVTLTGTGTLTPIAATNGAITVQLVSNATTTNTGFEFNIACIDPTVHNVPNTGNDTWVTCDGHLYDFGGPTGNYANSWNGYTIIYPPSQGSYITIQGSYIGEGCCDHLYIYDGAGIGGTQLCDITSPTSGTSINVGPFISTTGPLTVQFTSDLSNAYQGFDLIVSCYTPDIIEIPTTGNNTVTTCGGILLDDGSFDGGYSNNSDGYTTIYPGIAGNNVSLSGTYSVENNNDFIYIYDGEDTNAPLITVLTGAGTLAPIAATNGALTVQFTSNASGTSWGFNFNVTCIDPTTHNVPSYSNSTWITCDGHLYDAGGPTGNYENNWDGYTVIYPATAGAFVTIQGSYTGDATSDHLYIYDGVGTGATLLANIISGTSGNTVNVGPFTSTTGPLTVRFTSNTSLVYAGFDLTVSCYIPTVAELPSTGNNSVTACEGYLYDDGGEDNNYSNDCDGYTTLYPGIAGNNVSLSGIYSVENNNDFIYIYDGEDTNAPLIATLTGTGTLTQTTATNGALTVQLVSNATNSNFGINFNITCIDPNVHNVPSTGNDTWTTCGGHLYDAGGPTGNYGNNWNGYTVIYPDSPTAKVSVSGTLYAESFEKLYFYNGVGTGAALLATISGAGTTTLLNVGPITSTNGPLTVKFYSDGSNFGAGFDLIVSCIDPCPPEEPTVTTPSGTNVCLGGSLNIFANSTEPDASYYWYDSPEMTNLLDVASVFNAPATQAGTVTYYVATGITINNTTCYSDPVPVTINVSTLDAPDVVVENNSVCLGSPATFNINTLIPDATYYWYDVPTGGVPIADGTSFSTILDDIGTHTYYVETFVGNEGGVGEPTSLSSGFNQNNGNGGIMFDIEAFGCDVTITAVDGQLNYSGVSGSVDFYYRTNSCETTWQNNTTGWIYLGCTNVISNGGGTATYLQFPQSVTIPAGERYALCIMAMQGFMYQDGTAFGNLVVSNADIAWYEGFGTTAYGNCTEAFTQTSVNNSRIFRGTVYYSTSCEPEACYSERIPVTVNAFSLDNPTATADHTSICLGNSVTFTASGTTDNLEFLWFDEPTATVAVATGVNYTVTPTSAGIHTYYLQAVNNNISVNPCYSDLVPVTIMVDNNLEVSLLADNTILNCNNFLSTITTNAIGGNGFFAYQWSNGSFANSIPVTTGGTYTVTTTSGTCSATASITINEDFTIPPVVIRTIDGTEINCSHSQINVTLENQNENYSYHWNSGGSTTTANNVFYAGGTYSVTVTDNANGCSASSNVTITMNLANPIAGIINHTNTTLLSCAVDTIQLSATGGDSYHWSNGRNTANITVTNPGNYIVTVVATNGCTASTNINITQNIEAPEIDFVSNTGKYEINCSIQSITISATNNTNNYSYTWSGGYYPNQNSNVFSQVGTYSVTVTNTINKCSSTAIVAITTPDTLEVYLNVDTTTVLCYGDLANVEVLAMGGTPPYQGIGNFTIGAGNHSFTVTDANGCTETLSLSFSQPPELSLDLQQTEIIKCYGEETASIISNVSGGKLPYTYIWNNSTNTFTGNTAELTNLAAGSYSLTVNDFNSCSITKTITITEPANFVMNYDSKDILCNGDNNGSLNILLTGGIKPYKYEVTSGEYFRRFVDSYSGLKPGVYNIFVSDFNNCSHTGEVTITEPPKIESNYTTQAPSCMDALDGQISIYVQGGIAPYNYYIDDKQYSDSALCRMTSGSYNIVIKDSNNCIIKLDKVKIEENNNDCLFIPTVITPNGDGINDTWVIDGLELLDEFEILVFNRWGQRLYKSTTITDQKWDGKYKNKLVPSGTYLYIVNIKGRIEKKYTGTISVIY